MWLLEELEVPYELDIHHREPNKLAPPAAEKLHPLGKFPIVSVIAPSLAEPVVLAESAFIVQWMSEHFTKAKNLIPSRWKDGQHGKIGGETESWMRYQYLMYYAEGSFMFTMVVQFITLGLKGNNIPFFIRPITRFIGNKISSFMVFPNSKRHFTLLEQYLSTSPEGGKYLCGPDLTGADIMFAYPLQAGLEMRAFDDMGGTWEKGSFQDTFPNLHAYIKRLAEEPGWKRALQKIKEIEGSASLLP
ncbi:hypothetical protein OQA88_451 [Cercophora sp. LCS_1]